MNLPLEFAHRLEDRKSAQDVDLGAEKGIRPARRHLQPSQVNDVRDLIFLQRLSQPGQIGDVALDECYLPYLRLVHDEAHSLGIFLEIVDPDAIAACQEVACDPTADATVTAGEEYIHD